MQSGNLRVLASTASVRSPISPDIPTLKESGYSGFEPLDTNQQSFGALLRDQNTSWPKMIQDAGVKVE